MALSSWWSRCSGSHRSSTDFSFLTEISEESLPPPLQILSWTCRRKETRQPDVTPCVESCVESKNVTQFLMFCFNCVCNWYVTYKHKSIQLNTTFLKDLTELPLCFSSTICTIPMQTMFKIQSHFATRWQRRLWFYHMECVHRPQWWIMGKGLKCLLSVHEWYADWHSGTTHSSLMLKRRIFSVWAADPPLRSMCCSHTLWDVANYRVGQHRVRRGEESWPAQLTQMICWHSDETFLPICWICQHCNIKNINVGW